MAPKATIVAGCERGSTCVAGSEGNVRHCALGAGSLLKWSAPLGFAVAQHGFRGFGAQPQKLVAGPEGNVRHCAAFEPATAAPKATFLAGSEGNVRHCALGAGSLLKWSAHGDLL